MVRTRRRPRHHARGGLRGGRWAYRRVRALLLVHGGNRDVPRERGDAPGARRAGERRARCGAAGRDGSRRRRSGRGGGGAPGSAPVRGAGIRRLSAAGRVRATLYTDGGARGNPGPAAFAYVLEADDGTVLDAQGEAIGVATNNVAEYRALVAGLERAAEAGVTELEGVSGSEVLVKQMKGEY